MSPAVSRYVDDVRDVRVFRSCERRVSTFFLSNRPVNQDTTPTPVRETLALSANLRMEPAFAPSPPGQTCPSAPKSPLIFFGWNLARHLLKREAESACSRSDNSGHPSSSRGWGYSTCVIRIPPKVVQPSGMGWHTILHMEFLVTLSLFASAAPQVYEFAAGSLALTTPVLAASNARESASWLT
jgi:hypothetical protein